jgi:hypothetical protein
MRAAIVILLLFTSNLCSYALTDSCDCANTLFLIEDDDLFFPKNSHRNQVLFLTQEGKVKVTTFTSSFKLKSEEWITRKEKSIVFCRSTFSRLAVYDSLGCRTQTGFSLYKKYNEIENALTYGYNEKGQLQFVFPENWDSNSFYNPMPKEYVYDSSGRLSQIIVYGAEYFYQDSGINDTTFFKYTENPRIESTIFKGIFTNESKVNYRIYSADSRYSVSYSGTIYQDSIPLSNDNGTWLDSVFYDSKGRVLKQVTPVRDEGFVVYERKYSGNRLKYISFYGRISFHYRYLFGRPNSIKIVRHSDEETQVCWAKYQHTKAL